MHFSEQEKVRLLQLKYVGLTVIERLEQIGIYSFEQLAKEKTEDICQQIAAAIGSNCWKNSPQAKAAISAAIALAQQKS